MLHVLKSPWPDQEGIFKKLPYIMRNELDELFSTRIVINSNHELINSSTVYNYDQWRLLVDCQTKCVYIINFWLCVFFPPIYTRFVFNLPLFINMNWKFKNQIIHKIWIIITYPCLYWLLYTVVYNNLFLSQLKPCRALL